MPNSSKAEAEVESAPTSCFRSRASAPSMTFHRELGQCHVGHMRHGPDGKGPERSARARSPQIREEFWKNVSVPGAGEDLNQPGASRPGRRFPGVRRTALPRRPAPQRIVRRPFPRGIPVPRRRGQARRREIFLCRRMGIHGPDEQPPTLHKEPLVYEEVQPTRESTNKCLGFRLSDTETRTRSISCNPRVEPLNLTSTFGGKRTPRRRARLVDYQVDVAPTRRSSKCSIWSTRSSSSRARSRSRSITIAGKAFAEPAA